MGQEFTKFLAPHLWRQDEPESFAPIKYDPQFGFKEERRPKLPLATEQEMDSANLSRWFRNECAQYHIALMTCKYKNAPFFWRCKNMSDDLEHCYLEERYHDMKEFEREKRLNARERRLKEKAAKAA